MKPVSLLMQFAAVLVQKRGRAATDADEAKVGLKAGEEAGPSTAKVPSPMASWCQISATMDRKTEYCSTQLQFCTLEKSR